LLTTDTNEDGSPSSFTDRLNAAGKEGLIYGGLGTALGAYGATAGRYGLNRKGLKTMFSNPTSRNTPDGASDRGFFGDMAQSALFGSPVSAYKTYKKNVRRLGGSHMKALGEQFRQAYMPAPGTGLAGKGLHYLFTLGGVALPAYQAATTDDPNERQKLLARTAGGLVAAPFTGQLGLPGALIQQQVENLAERAVAGSPPPQQPKYSPATHLGVMNRGVRMNRWDDWA
jgi:hypothetical protein